MTSRETRNKCWVPEIAILLAAFAIFPCGISVAQASSDVEANLPTAPSALAHPESGGAQEAQFAPSAEASVNGTVMDAGGALVPGAKIEVDAAAHEDVQVIRQEPVVPVIVDLGAGEFSFRMLDLGQEQALARKADLSVDAFVLHVDEPPGYLAECNRRLNEMGCNVDGLGYRRPAAQTAAPAKT